MNCEIACEGSKQPSTRSSPLSVQERDKVAKEKQMKIIAIKDIQAEIWGNIQLIPAPGAAIRGFGDLCKDKTQEIGKHCEDYDLYILGDFNQEDNGEQPMSLYIKPERIAQGKNFKE